MTRLQNINAFAGRKHQVLRLFNLAGQRKAGNSGLKLNPHSCES